VWEEIRERGKLTTQSLAQHGFKRILILDLAGFCRVLPNESRCHRLCEIGAFDLFPPNYKSEKRDEEDAKAYESRFSFLIRYVFGLVT
jgi:hypothetical protein